MWVNIGGTILGAKLCLQDQSIARNRRREPDSKILSLSRSPDFCPAQHRLGPTCERERGENRVEDHDAQTRGKNRRIAIHR